MSHNVFRVRVRHERIRKQYNEDLRFLTARNKFQGNKNSLLFQGHHMNIQKETMTLIFTLSDYLVYSMLRGP